MWKPLILIILMILIGTTGYYFIEEWELLDAFYMTVITIFTVGFREVGPLSRPGQVFTIFIILGGAGTAIFAFTKIGEIIFEGGIREFWWRKNMVAKIDKIRDHYIICGHGRMGNIVRERLQEEKTPFVVIEHKENQLSVLTREKKCLYIIGDATLEEVLLRAGIKRAKGLAALLTTDADNLYLTMTAKMINPSLFVLARVVEDEAEKKLLQIGANKVVGPIKLGALRIAQTLVRPALVDFMDLIIRRKELSLSMEEYVLGRKAPATGKSLIECNIRKVANVIVVAVKKPGQDIVFNPSPDINLETGDTLLVLGDRSAISVFEKTFLEKK